MPTRVRRIRAAGASAGASASKRPRGASSVASSRNATCNSHQKIEHTSCPPGVDYDALPPGLYPRAIAPPPKVAAVTHLALSDANCNAKEAKTAEEGELPPSPPEGPKKGQQQKDGLQEPQRQMTSAQEEALLAELATARAHTAKRNEARRLAAETRQQRRKRKEAGAEAKQQEIAAKQQKIAARRARKRRRQIDKIVPDIPPPPPLSQEYLATIPEQYLRVMALTVQLHDRSSMTKCSNWLGAKAKTFLKPPLHILGGYSSWKDVLHGIRHYNEMSAGERQQEAAKARGLTRKEKAQLKANMDRLMANRPDPTMEGNVYDPPEQLEQLTAAAAARSEAATNHSSGEEIIRNREAARLAMARAYFSRRAESKEEEEAAKRKRKETQRKERKAAKRKRKEALRKEKEEEKAKKAELRSKRKQRAESEKKQRLEAKKLNYKATIARLEAQNPRPSTAAQE